MLTLRRGKFQNKETRFLFAMKGKKNNKNKEIWKKEITVETGREKETYKREGSKSQKLVLRKG